MAIIKVHNVPLVPQPTDGVCWYASARMLYRWSKTTGKGSMTNPQDNAVTSARFNDNASWDSNQNGLLAGYVGMQKFNGLDMDLDSLNSFFSSHGPIWTALQKNWGGHDYGHVVVICGVSDTGVFVHDPEPMTRGSGKWLTWGQINEAISSFAGGDFQYLTAA